jgi:hypothetical protein
LDDLVEDMLQRVLKLDVNDISFARYFLSKTIENARTGYRLLYVDRSRAVAMRNADQIAKLWNVPVSPASFAELPELLRVHGSTLRWILTSFYREDQVLSLVKGCKANKSIKVIPIRSSFAPEMAERIRALPTGSKILLLAEPEEYERSGQSFADAYQRSLGDPQLRFTVKPMASKSTLAQALESSKYQLVVVSNPIWEQLPEATRKQPKLMRPVFEMDKSSLEEARLRAGILQ